MTEKQKKPRAFLSASENVVVGSVGGIMETSLLMPVLTWKFCTQEGRPYPKFPGMYRGLGVQAGSVAPITSLQMVTNGMFEKLVTGGGRQLTDLEAVGCSMAAGAVSALVYTPVDMTMIFQQKLGKSPLQTLRYLVTSHGSTSPWRGFGACASREGLYTAGYLGIAPVMTKYFMKQEGWEESFFLSAVLGSSIAAVVANMGSHPIDTAKTVMQADVTGEKFKNARTAIVHLYSTNGIRSLYRGGLARTLRGCGAFFILSCLREKAIGNKTDHDSIF